MSCTVHQLLRDSKSVEVSVNGTVIPRDAIAREVQHHPASKPIEAWLSAARALVVRELLLQQARRIALAATPLSDEHGRRETEEDALIRSLIEREITTPEPDAASCRRFFDQNRHRFRALKALRFEQVSAQIADYLRESVKRRAIAQYIARLVPEAGITGIPMEDAEAHRVSRGASRC